MTEKILIRSTECYSVPDILISKLNEKPFPENRTGDIIDFIEHIAKPFQKGINHTNIDKKTLYKYKEEKINNDGIIKCTTYIGYSKSFDGIAEVKIYEYDPEQSMLISNYDVCEHLTPLKCINDKLNIWQ